MLLLLFIVATGYDGLSLVFIFVFELQILKTFSYIRLTKLITSIIMRHLKCRMVIRIACGIELAVM